MHAAHAAVVGLQPTVIASRTLHLLLEQSVMIQRIVDVRRPSSAAASQLNSGISGGRARRALVRSKII